MARIHFTRHLQRFFPELDTLSVEGKTVSELVTAVDREFPGLAAYLIDESGALRKHVNIFVDQEMIRDRRSLKDPVQPDDEVHVIQALSGG